MTIPNDALERVLVAGASVRAAVHSVDREGVPCVIAADLFQDRDLADALRCPLVDGYRNLPAVAAQLQPDAWMYTGGLENHPELVAAVRAPLLGNSPATLRAVRDPWEVAAALQSAGITTLDLARCGDNLPRDGSWLCKRRNSAAGRGHAIVEGSFIESSHEAVYYQQRAVGEPTSAVFVAADGECRLWGVTRQLIGVGDPRAGVFQYLGSVGPLRLSSSLQNQWRDLGAALVRRFSLTGLFGVDAIQAGEQILPVEVNPRYTASIEVLERASGWNAWQLHYQACCHAALPPLTVTPPRWVAAKRILFAERDIWVSREFLEWAESENARREWPVTADLPAVAGYFPRGAPVLTVLSGPSAADDGAGSETEFQHGWARVQAALEGCQQPEDR